MIILCRERWEWDGRGEGAAGEPRGFPHEENMQCRHKKPPGRNSHSLSSFLVIINADLIVITVDATIWNIYIIIAVVMFPFLLCMSPTFSSLSLVPIFFSLSLSGEVLFHCFDLMSLCLCSAMSDSLFQQNPAPKVHLSRTERWIKLVNT